MSRFFHTYIYCGGDGLSSTTRETSNTERKGKMENQKTKEIFAGTANTQGTIDKALTLGDIVIYSGHICVIASVDEDTGLVDLLTTRGVTFSEVDNYLLVKTGYRTGLVQQILKEVEGVILQLIEKDSANVSAERIAEYLTEKSNSKDGTIRHNFRDIKYDHSGD